MSMNGMIQLVGFCCVLGGTMGMGYSYIYIYKSRMVQTDQFLQLLEGIRQEITYSHIPLGEVCRELAQRLGEPYQNLLHGFYERILQKQGENIASIWKEELGKTEDKILLSKEMLQLLYHLMDPIGYANIDMQVKKIELQIEKVRDELEKQKREQENKTRIYFSISLMGGLLIGILFL